MAFLSEDYKEPITSNYLKLEEGENVIRILGSFESGEGCMGMEYWKQNGEKKKPIRYSKDLPAPLDDLEETDDYGNLKMPTFFWAIPVYNVLGNKVQIFQITQKTIRTYILGLARNKKWGDPKEYNIVITKTKENGKTSYSVTPEPKEKLDQTVLDQYKAMNINWAAYMKSEDPFKESQSHEVSSADIANDAAEALEGGVEPF